MAVSVSPPPPVIIDEWLPTIRSGIEAVPDRRRPSALTSSASKSIIDAYLERLADVGLDDPTSASAVYAKARELQRDSRNVKPDPDLHRDDAKVQVRRQIQDLTEKAQAAYHSAVRALYDYGEGKWLTLLKPIAVDAVGDQDEEAWSAVHKLAAFLRRSDVAALASMPGFGPECYQLARPDGYHLWRLHHSRRAHPIRTRRNGSAIFICSVVTEGPHPGLSDFEGGWEPGLFSAEEALINLIHVVDEQEAAYAVAAPEARTSRRMMAR